MQKKRGITSESADELIKEIMEADYSFHHSNDSLDKFPKPEDLAEGEFWLKPRKKKGAIVSGRTIIRDGKPVFLQKDEISETI